MDLFVRETARILEISVAWFGRPRRHVTAFGDGDNLGSMLTGVFVRQERKRPDTAGMMAGRALLENEGRDVPVEGDWGCGEREWEDEEENTVDSHGVSFILAGVKLTRSSCLALILLL